MRIRCELAAVVTVALVFTGCHLHGQSSGAATLRGNWVVDRSFGVSAPPGFETAIVITGKRVTLRSRWTEPKDGQYGLTLIGVATPDIVLDMSGQETATQVGPYVLTHHSALDAGRLVTQWSTSEYMGSSFHGTWTRAVSRSGDRLTLDIDAISALGDISRARLIFRRE